MAWPLTTHLKNNPSKAKKICWKSKDKHIRNVLLWTPNHRRTSVDRPARTYLHQLYVDTGCSWENLSGTMDDRN